MKLSDRLLIEDEVAKRCRIDGAFRESAAVEIVMMRRSEEKNTFAEEVVSVGYCFGLL